MILLLEKLHGMLRYNGSENYFLNLVNRSDLSIDIHMFVVVSMVVMVSVVRFAAISIGVNSSNMLTKT